MITKSIVPENTQVLPDVAGSPLIKGIDQSKLDSFAPKTELGQLMKDIAAQTSTFLVKVADIAVGGTDIYAINQEHSSRQVYKYSGQGTTWNELTAMPDNDVAYQIEVAAGKLFAIANNSQNLYQYNASTNAWSQVGSIKCLTIRANGNYLAIIDQGNKPYYMDASTSGATPVSSDTTASMVAQCNDGNQYVIGSGNFDLSHIDVAGNTTTQLETDAVNVFVSDTNQAYYSSNTGTLYSLDASGNKTALPAMG